MNAGFTILDHPADLGVEARGRDLPEAFRQAAAGLMSIIVDPLTVTSRETRLIVLDAGDVHQLLIRWLSELLYLYDGQRFISSDFVMDHLTTTTLRAHVAGEHFAPERHRMRLDVKAVTYHQLEVREEADGTAVRVFLDV